MAVPNVGAVTHLTAEVLRARSGPNFTVVAYRGAGQAIQDAVGGQVNGFYDALVPTGAQVQGGRLRAHLHLLVDGSHLERDVDAGHVPQAEGDRNGVERVVGKRKVHPVAFEIGNR